MPEAQDPSGPGGVAGSMLCRSSSAPSATHSGPFYPVHSRSARNVSSTEGSSRPMLESLSMLSPSRLRGSIWSSSSSGNGVSMFRLTSGMPASALLRSLNRLVLESSGRSGEWVKTVQVRRHVQQTTAPQTLALYLLAKTAMAYIPPHSQGPGRTAMAQCPQQPASRQESDGLCPPNSQRPGSTAMAHVPLTPSVPSALDSTVFSLSSITPLFLLVFSL